MPPGNQRTWDIACYLIVEGEKDGTFNSPLSWTCDLSNHVQCSLIVS